MRAQQRQQWQQWLRRLLSSRTGAGVVAKKALQWMPSRSSSLSGTKMGVKMGMWRGRERPGLVLERDSFERLPSPLVVELASTRPPVRARRGKPAARALVPPLG